MNKGLLALFLVCLSISSLTIFESAQVLAISASTRNTVVEPGSGSSPCDIDIYIDTAASYGAKDCHTGKNFRFSASADLGALLNTERTTDCPTVNGIQSCDFYIESGVYTLTTTHNMFTNEAIHGAGQNTLISCLGGVDCFTISQSVTAFNMVMDNVQVSASGNIFNAGAAGVLLNSWFYRMNWTCATTGFSCFLFPAGSKAYFNHFLDLILTGGASNTKPIFSVVGNNGGGEFNENTIGPGVAFEVSGTWALVLDEKVNNSFLFGNRIFDDSCDPTVGGCIAMYGCESNVIDSVNIYDTVTPTNPMIFISKDGTGSNSHDITISNIYSRAGTSLKPDIQLDPAAGPGGAIIIEPNVNYVDIGASPGVTVIMDNSATTVHLLEIAASTLIIQDGQITTHISAAATSQKAETGADATLLSYTPLPIIGSYQACITLSLSAANTATIGWTATWTDSNANAQTPTNLALFQSGTAAPALTFTTSVAGNYFACANLDVNNAAVAIVIKTTFSGTSIAYKASATIMRLQ